MDANQLVTLGQIAEFVNVPPHRIIHLCERDLVRPAVPAEGRGTVRRFDRDNAFRILLALYLEDLGLQHDVIRLLMEGIDELLDTDVIKDHMDSEVVIDAPAVFDRLGDDENPAMGLVALKIGREREVQFVLPRYSEPLNLWSGSIFLMSMPFDRIVGNMSLCVVVNLTMIARLII